MTKRIILFVLLLSVPLIASAEAMDLSAEVKNAFSKARLPLAKEKRQPPDWTLKTVEGKNITLSQLKGKIVFINFWATWCPPCRSEMPSMEALYKRFRGDGLEFVAVDIAEDAAGVRKFLNEYKLTFPVVLDANGAVSNNYGIQGIPATFVIDRDGKVILSTVGGRDWNTPAIITAFDMLLKHGQ
jgi:thiol-disulfide isomerase/thioredoxin